MSLAVPTLDRWCRERHSARRLADTRVRTLARPTRASVRCLASKKTGKASTPSSKGKASTPSSDAGSSSAVEGAIGAGGCLLNGIVLWSEYVLATTGSGTHLLCYHLNEHFAPSPAPVTRDSRLLDAPRPSPGPRRAPRGRGGHWVPRCGGDRGMVDQDQGLHRDRQACRARGRCRRRLVGDVLHPDRSGARCDEAAAVVAPAGLPPGPAGLLGGAEGLSYFSLLGALVAFGKTFFEVRRASWSPAPQGALGRSPSSM